MNLQTVEKGDTAESFALRYNLTIGRLKELNPEFTEAIDNSVGGANGRVLIDVTKLKVPPAFKLAQDDSTHTFLENAKKEDCDLKDLEPEQAVEILKKLNPDRASEIARSYQASQDRLKLEKKTFVLKDVLTKALVNQKVNIPPEATPFTVRGVRGKQKLPSSPLQSLSTFLAIQGVGLDEFKAANAAHLTDLHEVDGDTKTSTLKYSDPANKRLIVPSPRTYLANDTPDAFRERVNVDIEKIEALNPNLIFRPAVSATASIDNRFRRPWAR